jgi:predicted transcriptional regulator
LPSKRSKLEIYIDILSAIKKGIYKPTKIMYRTNLSWKPLMEILDSLVGQELIKVKEDDEHKIYEITEKGKNVLEYFSRAMQSIEIT